MSRRRQPPKLWLKPAERGRNAVWCIKDGTRRISTGCGARDLERAEQALAEHIRAKYEAPRGLGQCLLVSEAVAAYLAGHAAHVEHPRSREFLFDTARPTLEWWSGKTIAEVNGTNCRRYVAWRTAQKYRGRNISDQTARHDLKTLRAALNWFKREIDPALIVPKVTLPPKALQRLDYWLTESEVERRLKAAWKNPHTHHVARVILIGVYSGTRPGAMLGLRWLPSATAGWFDLEAGVLHRRGAASRQSNKRQPPARIHRLLLPHLRRWRADDLKHGITNVVHYQGRPVAKLRHSWATVAKLAGAARKDGAHILRHTAATRLMQSGVDLYEAAGFLGMTPQTLWDTYGHHHPDFHQAAATATPKRKARTSKKRAAMK